jgi:hypothetical protein
MIPDKEASVISVSTAPPRYAPARPITAAYRNVKIRPLAEPYFMSIGNANDGIMRLAPMLTLRMNRRRWISKPPLIAMDTQAAMPERTVQTAQSRKVLKNA